ncbi:MAG: HAMP domain-containing protein [Alphaproteobacteria bacterium]|nr:HAMP domain-containing protein [Alphaproteobacteria bacterium]
MQKITISKAKPVNTSLVTRASQILALIITFSFTGMIASTLISESLNDEALKISTVNSLSLATDKLLASNLADSSSPPEKLISEFYQELNKTLLIPLPANQEQQQYYQQLSNIHTNWSNKEVSVTKLKILRTQLPSLLSHFQSAIQKKIRLLRILQYSGFFITILIAYIATYSLQGMVVTPLKKLVILATNAGRGDFTLRADEKAKGELGLLAKTLNDMSEQLNKRYQELESNVADKTTQLENKNRSLDMLYRSSRSLASEEQDIDSLISKLSHTIDIGYIFLSLTDNKSHIDTKPKDNRHLYPINKQDHHYGYLIWEIERHYIPEPWQVDLLQAMSNLIATFIDIQNKRRAESHLEISEERSVIARELHDSLAQSLSYLKLQISLLNKQTEKGLPQNVLTATLNEISYGANIAYGQLREILTTFRLRLNGEPLESALIQTIDEFTQKCNHPITLDYQLNNNALTPHQEIHLVQIIREALSNIHKHAQATQASIVLTERNNAVIVNIKDDGVGMPKTSAKEGHFGIKIMQERALSLHGQLHITNHQPSGTHISLTIQQNKT